MLIVDELKVIITFKIHSEINDHTWPLPYLYSTVGLRWPNGIVQGLFGGEAHSSLGNFLFRVNDAEKEGVRFYIATNLIKERCLYICCKSGCVFQQINIEIRNCNEHHMVTTVNFFGQTGIHRNSTGILPKFYWNSDRIPENR